MAYLLAHRSLHSSTVSASERAGLTQQELGDLLGVGRAQVAHAEAGRRGYSARAQARLNRLAELLPRSLPPVPESPAAAPAPGPTLAEQADLHRRLRNARRTLNGLAYAEENRPPMAAALARRTQALAVLRAALAAEANAADTTREAAWLELVELGTARVARRQPSPTARGLVALRREVLTLEIAGLEKLLAGT